MQIPRWLSNMFNVILVNLCRALSFQLFFYLRVLTFSEKYHILCLSVEGHMMRKYLMFFRCGLCTISLKTFLIITNRTLITFTNLNYILIHSNVSWAWWHMPLIHILCKFCARQGYTMRLCPKSKQTKDKTIILPN